MVLLSVGGGQSTSYRACWVISNPDATPADLSGPAHDRLPAEVVQVLGVDAEVVADLVDHGASDLLDDLFLGAADRADRMSEDGDPVRHHLTRIIAEPGSTVPIGQPIAVIGDGAPTRPDPEVRRVLSSPLARSLARKHGLDPARITGTGPGGRIVRADVEEAIAHSADPGNATATAPTDAEPPPAAPAPDGAAVTGQVQVTDERIPLTSIRRITAQRLTESAAAPHFYLTSVVDVGALLELRTQMNETLGDTAPKVSVTDLLIRACAMTLRSHPQVNSSWAGDHLLRHGRINVGFAVALDEGLIVPVLRDADRLRLTEIATEAHRLTERARSGRLAPDEFTGGTFTISNLGTYGIDHFTAVINPPEAAILAVGAAQQEAVVRDGELAVATTMKITLTVDHRVLDGATAAAFLRELVAALEHPLRIIV